MTHYFDLKMDLGWNRDMKDNLEKKDSFISEIVTSPRAWYTTSQKEKRYFKISSNLKYQIVVVSEMNCGSGYQQNIAFAKQLNNIEMYTLSSNVHPNTYDGNFNNIQVNTSEFQRLLRDSSSFLKNG